MSIAPISLSQQGTAAASALEKSVEINIDPKNFLFLIPTITGIALGIIFLPNFTLGLAAGFGMVVVTVISLKLLTVAGLIEDIKEEKSEYAKMLGKESLEATLFGPIAEESLFRGGMQPLLTKAIEWIIPSTAAALIGPSFSIAATTSILVTGVFFGALHYLNPHKAALHQAVVASIGGVAFGALAAQFGFGAAVAAHIANNTLAISFSGFQPPSEGSDFEPRPQIKSKYTSLPA